MRLPIVLSLLLAGTVLLASCDDTLPPPTGGQDSTLSVTVHDASGNPVSGASVGLLFTFTPTSDDVPHRDLTLPFPNPATGMTSAEFKVPAPASVKLLLLHYGTRELLQTLTNGTLDAGMHAIEYDVTTLPNQGYIYQLNNGDTVEEQLMLVMRPDTADFIPLLTTDNAGHFSIDPKNLPIGEKIIQTFESGQTGAHQIINNKLGLIIKRPGGSSMVRWITVDSAHGVDTTFVLP